MKNKAYQYYTELPQWAKGVVVVAGAGAALFVGYQVYRGVKRLFPTDTERKAREIVNSATSDVDKWRRQGLRQSFPDLQYKTWAASVYEGMRYCVGDNYSGVEDVMKKLQNNLDVALLVQSFGLRQNYCFGIPAGDPMDMLTFIKRELGDEWGGLTDYRVVRINADWSKKGITYKI